MVDSGMEPVLGGVGIQVRTIDLVSFEDDARADAWDRVVGPTGFKV